MLKLHRTRTSVVSTTIEYYSCRVNDYRILLVPGQELVRKLETIWCYSLYEIVLDGWNTLVFTEIEVQKFCSLDEVVRNSGNTRVLLKLVVGGVLHSKLHMQ